MGEIKIIKKPDSMSWDIIHDVLYKAHESNRQKGVYMRTATLTGDELRKRVGTNGQCFVALDGDKVVATASVKFVERNGWYHKGLLADLMLLGIIPEYKGRGLYGRLLRERCLFAQSKGVDIVEMDTAEGNVLMRSIAAKHGFKSVMTKASTHVKHYSVVLVKWLNGCPFSDTYCSIHYRWQTFKYKLHYKRGYVKRFKF